MTSITYNDKTISEAEMKLGLNLFKAIVKIASDDSAKIIELKDSVEKIDETLKHCDEESLLLCNQEMTRRFRNILLAPGTGLRIIDEQTMRRKNMKEKYDALYSIGLCLFKEICREKFGYALQEGTKIGIEYAVDKAKEAMRI